MLAQMANSPNAPNGSAARSSGLSSHHTSLPASIAPPNFLQPGNMSSVTTHTASSHTALLPHSPLKPSASPNYSQESQTHSSPSTATSASPSTATTSSAWA